MALKRKDVPAPMVPAEVVDMESVGGEVIVRGVPLSVSFEINRETKDAPHLRASSFLARSVLRDENAPLWTVEQWEAFSCTHRADYLQLLAVSQRLSGLDSDESEKH